MVLASVYLDMNCTCMVILKSDKMVIFGVFRHNVSRLAPATVLLLAHERPLVSQVSPTYLRILVQYSVDLDINCTCMVILKSDKMVIFGVFLKNVRRVTQNDGSIGRA